MPRAFELGDKVFAKVRGYPPWPARVDSVPDGSKRNKKYCVFFYGTSEIGFCKAEEIVSYFENKHKYKVPLKRQTFYKEAIRQIEEFAPFPNHSLETGKNGTVKKSRHVAAEKEPEVDVRLVAQVEATFAKPKATAARRQKYKASKQQHGQGKIYPDLEKATAARRQRHKASKQQHGQRKPYQDLEKLIVEIKEEIEIEETWKSALDNDNNVKKQNCVPEPRASPCKPSKSPAQQPSPLVVVKQEPVDEEEEMESENNRNDDDEDEEVDVETLGAEDSHPIKIEPVDIEVEEVEEMVEIHEVEEEEEEENVLDKLMQHFETDTIDVAEVWKEILEKEGHISFEDDFEPALWKDSAVADATANSKPLETEYMMKKPAVRKDSVAAEVDPKTPEPQNVRKGARVVIHPSAMKEYLDAAEKEKPPETQNTTKNETECAVEREPVNTNETCEVLSTHRKEKEARIEIEPAVPVGSEPEPSMPEPEPATPESQLVTAEPEPVMAELEQVTAEPEQVTAEPEQVMAEPEQVTAEPEQVTAEPEQVMAEPEHVTAEPEHVTAEPEHVMAELEPVTAEPEPVTPELEPVTLEPEVVMPEPEVVMPEPELVMPDPEPVIQETESVMPEIQNGAQEVRVVMEPFAAEESVNEEAQVTPLVTAAAIDNERTVVTPAGTKETTAVTGAASATETAAAESRVKRYSETTEYLDSVREEEASVEMEPPVKIESFCSRKPLSAEVQSRPKQVGFVIEPSTERESANENGKSLHPENQRRIKRLRLFIEPYVLEESVDSNGKAVLTKQNGGKEARIIIKHIPGRREKRLEADTGQRKNENVDTNNSENEISLDIREEEMMEISENEKVDVAVNIDKTPSEGNEMQQEKSREKQHKEVDEDEEVDVISNKTDKKILVLKDMDSLATLQILSEGNVEVELAKARRRKYGRPHKCPTCGLLCLTPSKLRLHMRCHTGERPHGCQQCGKSFATGGNLQRHILIHSGLRPFSCDTCGAAFTEKSNMLKHMLVHSGLRPHHCDVCGKGFTRRGELRRHSRSHSGERPYTCDLCHESFQERAHLVIHIRRHTGERPFKCDECGRAFAHRYNLKTHLRTHTRERPYKCTHCPQAFSKRNNLVVHERLHTGERPFKCVHCDRRFADRSHFNRHRLTHEDIPDS